jgi:hypothetical protein
MLALLAGLGCAAAPPPGDSAHCAMLFDQLDGVEWLPAPGGFVGFDFRQQQLARIRQARCMTFTRQIDGLEALAEDLAPHEMPGGPAMRPVAVQAGVVTNMPDAARAQAFFASLGYRSRTVGWPEVGTRVYVEARTSGQVEDILALARRAGFVGPYVSRFAVF